MMKKLNELEVGHYTLSEEYGDKLIINDDKSLFHTLCCQGKAHICYTPNMTDLTGYFFNIEDYPWLEEHQIPKNIILYDRDEFIELLVKGQLPEGRLHTTLLNGYVTNLGIYEPDENIRTGNPFYLSKQAYINVLKENDSLIIWNPNDTGLSYDYTTIVRLEEDYTFKIIQEPGHEPVKLDDWQKGCKMSIKSFVDSIESGGIIEGDGTFGGTYINGYKSNLGVYTKDTGNCFGGFPVPSEEFSKLLKKTKSYVLWYNK